MFPWPFALEAVAAVAFPGIAQRTPPAEQPPARVTLTRLDCGSGKAPRDIASFSDSHALDGQKKLLVASCYLIRHGDKLMLWDTGYPAAIKDDPKSPFAMPKTIIDQLRELSIDPAKIDYVGISHYHGDHVGQARDFPAATLLIGYGDWAMLTAADRPVNADPAPLANWITGAGKRDIIRGDKDVFGDASVTILATPGHTPGHKSLLVRMAGNRYYLISGDLTHFASNYATDAVPSGNTSRAETLASLARFKALAANLKATVVIQHDPADIDKLPLFPEAAE
jgi:glyoxylase-like metal-dependent hydrolase (beta-lactamase superfamily II)